MATFFVRDSQGYHFFSVLFFWKKFDKKKKSEIIKFME